MFTDKDAGAHQSLFYLCGFLCLISLFSASSSLLLSNCTPEIRLSLKAHFQRWAFFKRLPWSALLATGRIRTKRKTENRTLPSSGLERQSASKCGRKVIAMFPWRSLFFHIPQFSPTKEPWSWEEQTGRTDQHCSTTEDHLFDDCAKGTHTYTNPDTCRKTQVLN